MEITRNIYEKLHSIKGAGIKLQRDTKAFNYKYATLSQIQDKFWELLQEQGLIVIHQINNWKVITTITDTESKDFISSEIEMTVWVKPQDKGSEITYYRRYNLLSLLDLEVEDDDWKKAQDSKVEVKDTKLWLNYEDFEAIVEAGNTTEEQIARVIKEDWYTLSQLAKNAVRHFVNTGELDKNLFYKQAR